MPVKGSLIWFQSRIINFVQFLDSDIFLVYSSKFTSKMAYNLTSFLMELLLNYF